MITTEVNVKMEATVLKSEDGKYSVAFRTVACPDEGSEVVLHETTLFVFDADHAFSVAAAFNRRAIKG